MDPQILIDAIVRQTTIVIARISTSQGVRSPLSHVANEVFVGLVHELENQGVGKKVIADMFGLALRSYRQKVQRLGESATTRGISLWTAVHGYLSERESASRKQLLQRFAQDEESSVRGILNDLVESGLVMRSGRGNTTAYRVATPEELKDLGSANPTGAKESNAAFVWLQVYREGPLTRDDLSRLVRLEPEALDAALSDLLVEGRIRVATQGEAGPTYAADQCLIPLGEAAGWEAAIVDHHQAVLNALASKLTSGQRSAQKQDEVGGTTLSFDLWPGHPHEAEVRRLLAKTREDVIPLWERVNEYNVEQSAQSKNPTERREDEYQVHYYCGQYVREDDET